MKWAKGYRVDNTAGEAIGAALPKLPRIRKHLKALLYGESGRSDRGGAAIRGRGSVELGLEFLMLTVSRSGEVRGARWEGIGLGVASGRFRRSG